MVYLKKSTLDKWNGGDLDDLDRDDLIDLAYYFEHVGTPNELKLIDDTKPEEDEAEPEYLEDITKYPGKKEPEDDNRPTLEKCLLRYFKNGDYDLIDGSEFYEIALYMKDPNLVRLVATADPGAVVDALRAFQAGKIKTPDELRYVLEDCSKEDLTQFVLDMHFSGMFTSIMKSAGL